MEVTRSFIAECLQAWKDGARLPYAITMRESNDPIGMIEARIQNTAVGLGYVLARSHWGRGLMPEAIRGLADAALSISGIFRMQAFCVSRTLRPSGRSKSPDSFARDDWSGIQ